MSHPIDVFVVGAMKSATTILCEWLDAQPGLAVSRPKEPAIFVAGAEAARQLPDLSTLYSHAEAGDLWIDGSTDYSKFPTIDGVPARVHRHNPDARIVYVMRHPVERVLSQYRFERLLKGSSTSFRDALASTPQLLDNSRYAMQLEQWLTCFPAGRIHLVTSEALARDMSGQVRRVLEFLQVPASTTPVAPDSPQTNDSTLIVLRSRRLRRLRKAPVGRAIRSVVPEPLVEAYKRRVHRRASPEVSEHDLRHMQEVLDPDLRALAHLTSSPGLTCSSWLETAADWDPVLSSH